MVETSSLCSEDGEGQYGYSPWSHKAELTEQISMMANLSGQRDCVKKYDQI